MAGSDFILTHKSKFEGWLKWAESELFMAALILYPTIGGMIRFARTENYLELKTANTTVSRHCQIAQSP